jgi:predicted dehydrogenase
MTGLRWGILATGGISRTFAHDLRLHGHEIAAVGSRSAAASEDFAAEFAVPRAHASYEALAADPGVDIVYIGTPHPMHAENARLALEHGKHVLVEKAFTLNAPEAAGLRDLGAERGLLVMEAMWTRYLPHMARIRELVSSGALGEIRLLTADHSQRLPDDPLHRLNALDLGGGALLDLAVYPLSFAWDVLGRPSAVQATARFGETGADTDVAVQLRHEGGAISSLTSSMRAAGPNVAAIVGTEARIEIDRTWYMPAGFRLIAADGAVLEAYESDPVEGTGLFFEALAAERFVAEGRISSDVLPIDESVGIMETLDEVRRMIGMRYPAEV